MNRTALWSCVLLTVVLVFCGCQSPQKTGAPEETGSTQMEIIDAAEDFEGMEQPQREDSGTEPSEAPAHQGGIELPLIPG